MQHPSVRNLWPDTMNPFYESFKDFTWTRTVWPFKFNTLLIILTVKRRSDLTRSLTLVTFSSVFDVQGLPERGSSSTLSRPSKNALWHLKTCVLDRACSPSALFNFSQVSVAFSLSLTQFDRATLLEISFLRFRNASLLHTLTQLAVKSEV